MKELYRLKDLARLGCYALGALLLLAALSWCVPEYRAGDVPGQLYTIRHQELRDNNPLYTDLLLKSVKANGGYLVLGTSETNELPHGNYFDFLNADTTLDAGFSVIAGAGRTACTYFPLIQSNENVEHLKMIYYINPSYWCNKLAESNAEYFHRYVSTYVYGKANRPEDEDVERILRANLPNVRCSDRLVEPLAYCGNWIRRKYNQDLVFALDSSRLYGSLTFLDRGVANRRVQKGAVRPDSLRYNYSLNVSRDFDVNAYTLRAHPEAQYRYDELRTMVRLCRSRHIDIVYVLGPYNRLAFERVHPEEASKMQRVTEEVRRVLEDEGVAYVDCSALSAEPGAFADWQHHNSYGAYLIYQKIRDYVLEKEIR